MAQTARGSLYKPPCKGHLEVCAIYSETTVSGTLSNRSGHGCCGWDRKDVPKDPTGGELHFLFGSGEERADDGQPFPVVDLFWRSDPPMSHVFQLSFFPTRHAKNEQYIMIPNDVRFSPPWSTNSMPC